MPTQHVTGTVTTSVAVPMVGMSPNATQAFVVTHRYGEIIEQQVNVWSASTLVTVVNTSYVGERPHG